MERYPACGSGDELAWKTNGKVILGVQFGCQ